MSYRKSSYSTQAAGLNITTTPQTLRTVTPIGSQSTFTGIIGHSPSPSSTLSSAATLAPSQVVTAAVSSLRLIQLSSDTVQFYQQTNVLSPSKWPSTFYQQHQQQQPTAVSSLSPPAQQASDFEKYNMHRINPQIAVRHIQSTQKCVLVKIKSNNPKAYYVSPSSMCLRPGEQDVFSFSLVDPRGSSSISSAGAAASTRKGIQTSKLREVALGNEANSENTADKFLVIAIEMDMNDLHKSASFRPIFDDNKNSNNIYEFLPQMLQTQYSQSTVAPQQSSHLQQLKEQQAKQQPISSHQTNSFQRVGAASLPTDNLFHSSNLKYQQRITIKVSVTRIGIESHSRIKSNSSNSSANNQNNNISSTQGHMYKNSLHSFSSYTGGGNTTNISGYGSMQGIPSQSSGSVLVHRKVKSGDPSPAMTVISENGPTTSHSSTLHESELNRQGTAIRIAAVSGVNANDSFARKSKQFEGDGAQRQHIFEVSMMERNHNNRRFPGGAVAAAEEHALVSANSAGHRKGESTYKSEYETMVRKVLEYEKSFQRLEKEIELAEKEKNKLSTHSSNQSTEADKRTGSVTVSLQFKQLLFLIFVFMLLGAFYARK